MARLAGKISFKIDGEIQFAKGAFDYNLGRDKKEMIVGHDTVHGHKSIPQVPFIEGKITDRGDLDLVALMDSEDVTITLDLANGKIISLRGAVYAADGGVNTEEAEVEVRFEGLSAEEIRA